jgi:hypothetical protein
VRINEARHLSTTWCPCCDGICTEAKQARILVAASIGCGSLPVGGQLALPRTLHYSYYRFIFGQLGSLRVCCLYVCHAPVCCPRSKTILLVCPPNISLAVNWIFVYLKLLKLYHDFSLVGIFSCRKCYLFLRESIHKTATELLWSSACLSRAIPHSISALHLNCNCLN